MIACLLLLLLLLLLLILLLLLFLLFRIQIAASTPLSRFQAKLAQKAQPIFFSRPYATFNDARKLQTLT